ncbi:MAG: SBBP repeat-containing protein [Terracidiphilus sp.]
MSVTRSFRFIPFAKFVSVGLLFAFVPAIAQQKNVSTGTGTVQPAVKTRIATSYGRIPLSFESNRGQTDPSVQFLSHGLGYTLLLRQGEAVLVLRGSKTTDPKAASRPDPREFGSSKSDDFETSLVRMKLIGADLHTRAREEDRQITRTNYFIGNDPAKWRTDIPNYGRIRYSDIYPGIDLVYYGNRHRLEHDFVVAPGADAGRIRLAVESAMHMRIDRATGDLILNTGSGELRLLKPVTYQEFSGHRSTVSSNYRLVAKNTIEFRVGSYNHGHPLVIDPVLVYSTYLGGSGNSKGNGDQGNGIAVDSSGDAYIVGTTYSTNFPLSSGAIQSLNYAAEASNNSTVFVSELNPAGTALVYSTYIGGSNYDFGYAIALDALRNVYIAGATYSVDFPATCGSFQTANPSKSEATSGFVAKLNPAGDGLVYSTFLGGEGDEIYPARGDVAQALAVDSAGDVYLTGYTWSANFPTTEGAFQTEFAGTTSLSNAFVAKLNPGGTGLLYSTFLGGSGSKNGGDYGNAIAIDSSGDAYVAGSTGSANFPVAKGALQTALTGPTNAFVTELNPGGTDEVYSTYLGGSGGDSAQAIALDSNGYVYVAGDTSSGDFPLCAGINRRVVGGASPLQERK